VYQDQVSFNVDNKGAVHMSESSAFKWIKIDSSMSITYKSKDS